jgi:SHS2 domain-containing protein
VLEESTAAVQSRTVTYRFVEHTAELEVELEAESAEGVFQEALQAFVELIGAGEGEAIERRVVLEARDLPALLAAWLDELVFLAETAGLVPEAAELSLSGSRLTARVQGRRGEPRLLVKAVTLHRLRLRRENGVWRGRMVLDV